MLNWFAKKLRDVQEAKRDERGFTLIELMVVIIIIAILAAIAIPAYLSQRDNAESNAAKANVRNAATAEQLAYTQTGSYVAVAVGAGAQDDITDFGFRQGDPAVAGTGSGASFCVSSTGGGQTWRMTQASGRPTLGAAC